MKSNRVDYFLLLFVNTKKKI